MEKYADGATGGYADYRFLTTPRERCATRSLTSTAECGPKPSRCGWRSSPPPARPVRSSQCDLGASASNAPRLAASRSCSGSASINAKQNDAAHGSPQETSLLPMAFPEGSPMHPSYGAGHAAVAGACVTVLKAYFDAGTELWETVEKTDTPARSTTSRRPTA